MKISLIAAIGKNKELGKNNKLLFRIPEDMKRFRQLTGGHAVIMGRKTFDSIGKPLPNRLNIIITRNQYLQEPSFVREKTSPCYFVSDWSKALELAKDWEDKHPADQREIFIIGGGQIYEQAIKFTDKLYLTIVEANSSADTFFPDYSDFKKVVFEEKGRSGEYKYKFVELER